MKDFHKWVSDMSGTISDNSYHKKDDANTIYITRARGELQIRMDMANLVVEDVLTLEDFEDWMTVFKTSRNGVIRFISAIVPRDITDEYYALDTEEKSLAWHKEFCRKIETGEIE